MDELRRTVREAVSWAERELAAAGVDAPRLSAELLAGRAFGLSRLGLITHHTDTPAPGSMDTFYALVARRAAGEPAAYILGEREFFGLDFRVTPDVLIPRPETEGIVEEAQRLFLADTPLVFADFGTGSGALAVTLAHEFPAARGLAVDISEQALAVASGNARANGVAERLDFVRADFTTLELPAASLDLLVSNPPYVTESEYAMLSPEVRDFEPALALVSPEEGLAHIRGLLPVAVRALRPGGVLLCELGCGQGPAALALTSESGPGLCNVTILKDYAGLDRILKAFRAD
ncbi:MAG: peptide chain release factor N(5)-glutamine methyltransferase [Humidesulfovibrio sp.]|nr:peptide chain release factor N(5)-glutamine methyltransferase [Humidesulfovibrio sp.]